MRTCGDDTIAVNAYAPFELTRLLAGAMTARRWGRIVMVASTAGAAGGPASSAYCAAKHAVVGLMRAVAQSTSLRYGVTCNAVLPGWVRDTGMSERTMQITAAREGITPEEALGADRGGQPGRPRRLPGRGRRDDRVPRLRGRGCDQR